MQVPLRSLPALRNSILVPDPHGTVGCGGRDGGGTPQDTLPVSLSPWWGGSPSHPLRQFNLIGINTVGFPHGHKTAAWGTPVAAVPPPVHPTGRAETRMGHTPARSPPFLTNILDPGPKFSEVINSHEAQTLDTKQQPPKLCFYPRKKGRKLLEANLCCV